MGTRAADLLAAALRQHVAALAAAEADLADGRPEAVHDARVATRRLRAVLGEFPRLVDDDVAADLRERLGSWGRRLGVARDLEVVLGLLDDDDAAVPAATRERAREQWEPRLEAALADAVAHLVTPAHTRLGADLATAAAHPPFTPVAGHAEEDELPRGVRRAARRIEHRERRAAALEAAPPGHEDPAGSAHAAPSDRGTGTTGLDDARHAVRKAVRRARYAAEVLALGSGGLAEQAAADVARYAEHQERLGVLTDAALLRRRLAELDGSADR